MDPNQFIMQLQQSGQVANLYADVRRGKALAAAIARTTVKDEDGNTIDPNEYFGELDEDEVAEAEAADAAVAEAAEADAAGADAADAGSADEK